MPHELLAARAGLISGMASSVRGRWCDGGARRSRGAARDGCATPLRTHRSRVRVDDECADTFVRTNETRSRGVSDPPGAARDDAGAPRGVAHAPAPLRCRSRLRHGAARGTKRRALWRAQLRACNDMRDSARPAALAALDATATAPRARHAAPGERHAPVSRVPPAVPPIRAHAVPTREERWRYRCGRTWHSTCPVPRARASRARRHVRVEQAVARPASTADRGRETEARRTRAARAGSARRRPASTSVDDPRRCSKYQRSSSTSSSRSGVANSCRQAASIAPARLRQCAGHQQANRPRRQRAEQLRVPMQEHPEVHGRGASRGTGRRVRPAVGGTPIGSLSGK